MFESMMPVSGRITWNYRWENSTSR